MRVIKYLGFYDMVGSDVGRVSNLAAVNKMNYISMAIAKAGFGVKFISASWIGDDSDKRFMWFERRKTENGSDVIFFPSWKTKSKFLRNIKIILTLGMFFVYLLLFVKKDEKVILYHVPWLSVPVCMAKRIKKFFLILEVEEIYKDVSSINSYFESMESNLLSAADAYIISTELLESKVKQTTRRPLVLYGTYEPAELLSSKFSDGLVHLVYAGVIDSHKRGAFNALEAMQFLGPNYVLHILGFGQVDMLLSEIERLEPKIAGKVIYQGIKQGDDFIRFCSSCHIGLSTQSMDGNYLLTSFPSKVLTYLSMGLSVVSCNIACVKNSKIGDLVDYYDVDTPEEIAKAIISVKERAPEEAINRLKALGSGFVQELKKLLGK